MRYEVREYKNRQYPFRVYSTNGNFKAEFQTLDDAIKDCDDRNEEFEYVVVYPSKPIEPQQTDWDAIYEPLWKSVPDWIGWMATDNDGSVYAYEQMPEMADNGFVCGDVDQYISIIAPRPDWKNSLRKKPTTI